MASSPRFERDSVFRTTVCTAMHSTIGYTWLTNSCVAWDMSVRILDMSFCIEFVDCANTHST
jgi:hypothetical protein